MHEAHGPVQPGDWENVGEWFKKRHLRDHLKLIKKKLNYNTE